MIMRATRTSCPKVNMEHRWQGKKLHLMVDAWLGRRETTYLPTLPGSCQIED